MRIIIFDDEKEYSERLEALIRECFKNMGFEDWTALHYSDTAAIMSLVPSHSDLIFLDIATKENENFGIEAAKKLRRENGDVHIAFITSHDEKIRDAVGGLIRPSEFLVKPIEGIEREKLFGLLEAVARQSEEKILSFKAGGMTYNIRQADILFIQKEDRKTVIHTENRCLNVRQSFVSVCESLDGRFIKIEKGIAVNLDAIVKYDPHLRVVYLTNDKQLYYSRDRAKKLRECFEEKGVRSV